MTSLKRIGLVASAAAVVLLLAWYLAVFQPQSKKLTNAHSAHAAAEVKISELQSQVSQLDVIKNEIPADTRRLATLEAAVPGNPELASALQQIEAAANASGAAVGSVGPSAPAGTGASSSSTQTAGPPAITVSLTASGSYGQVMSFLDQLKAMPRTVVVESLTLTGGSTSTGSPGSGTGGVSAAIGARIFYAGQPTP